MPRILLIDDDDLSREVFAMLFESEGYTVDAAASGDEALLVAAVPEMILSDRQMPGLCGDALALRLRERFGPEPRLVVMSGSQVPANARIRYDAFLLKPFTVEEFEAVLAGSAVDPVTVDAAGVLDEAIYERLCASMTPKQVGEMFAFCLDDAGKRLARMAQAVAEADDATYRREAHTIKGGCGMLGALELRHIAGDMESGGIELDRSENVTLRDQFVLASTRLERILDTRTR